MSIRRVSGVQADGARERLGLIKITKPSAKELWDKGIPLVLVGNNVNDAHFFDNFALAYRADCKNLANDGWTFDRLVGDFNFYLARELGDAVAFFVFADDLKRNGVKV